MKNTLHTRTEAGFSLVELMIAMTVIIVAFSAIALVTSSTGHAYQTGLTTAHLEAQVARTMDRITRELRIAGVATLIPAPVVGTGDPSLDFDQAVDFVAGSIVWTPTRRLSFEYELGEIDDGLDNNGNGLVDEGRVLLTEDLGGPGERSFVLTRWVSELLEGELPNELDDNGNGLVDEPGFCVERSGGPLDETLIVRLSLHRRDAETRLMTRTAQTSIRIKN